MPFQVGLIDLVGPARPKAIVGGKVIEATGTGDQGRQRLRIEQVRLDDLDVQAFEIAPVAAGPGHNADGLASLQQAANNGGTDEAGGAGNDDGQDCASDLVPARFCLR